MQRTAERGVIAGVTPVRERFRHSYSAEERRRILDTVLLERLPRWRARFGIMMLLSVVIAALGLLSDSPAIVIGAMLIAPLITPIQALAVAICMGWGERAVRYAAVVAGATLAGVALATAIGFVVPAESALPNEVLIRTSPDLRDLLIALAAGAAGAYATAREDVSSALPGVAVAVALVPPLATVGVTVSIGHPELAGGAVLLYLANLVAILFAAIAVLFVTGFIPVPHLERVKPRVLTGVATVTLAMVVIGIPLTGALAEATGAAVTRQRVAAAVVSWLGASRLEVTRLDIRSSTVLIDLSGPDAPPDVEQLTASLDELLGEETEVSVRWSQRAEVAPGQGGEADAEVAEIRRGIDAWIAEGGGGYVIESVERSSGLVVVELAGPTPPDATSLLAALSAKGIAPGTLQVRWSLQRILDSRALTPERLAVRSAVDRWAARWPGLAVLDVLDTADGVVVTVEGPEEPDDVDVLEREVTAAGGQAPVAVRFTLTRSITGADAAARRVQRAADAWATARGYTLTGVDGTPTEPTVSISGPVDVAALGLLGDALADAAGRFVWATVTTPGTAPIALPALPQADRAGAVVVPFGSRSTAVPPEHDAGLRQAAAAVAALDGGVVVVVGRSDADGSAAANLVLSRQRAEAVAARLVELGVPADRIHVRADGPSGVAARQVDVVVGRR